MPPLSRLLYWLTSDDGTLLWWRLVLLLYGYLACGALALAATDVFLARHFGRTDGTLSGQDEFGKCWCLLAAWPAFVAGLWAVLLFLFALRLAHFAARVALAVRLVHLLDLAGLTQTLVAVALASLRVAGHQPQKDTP